MLAWPDIAIIIGYFVIVLGLGAYLTRYVKTQEDFFLAGRKMPWWIVACSLQATDIGPETYIGVTGVVAASGLAWLNYDWLPACAIPNLRPPGYGPDELIFEKIRILEPFIGVRTS